MILPICSGPSGIVYVLLKTMCVLLCLLEYTVCLAYRNGLLCQLVTHNAVSTTYGTHWTFEAGICTLSLICCHIRCLAFLSKSHQTWLNSPEPYWNLVRPQPHNKVISMTMTEMFSTKRPYVTWWYCLKWFS